MNRRKIEQLVLPQLVWISGNIAILVLDYLYRVIKVLYVNGKLTSLRLQGLPSVVVIALIAALIIFSVLKLVIICKRIRIKRISIGYFLLNLIFGVVLFAFIVLIYSFDIVNDGPL